jgi:hypothetical protein
MASVGKQGAERDSCLGLLGIGAIITRYDRPDPKSALRMDILSQTGDKYAAARRGSAYFIASYKIFARARQEITLLFDDAIAWVPCFFDQICVWARLTLPLKHQ